MNDASIQHVAVELDYQAPQEVVAEAQRLLAHWLLIEYRKRKGLGLAN